jgi:aryl-alcohol dehydrogenase-like predicted oxidoreductase
MHYRKFGNTDLEVSEIGFGAWAIGGDAMVGKTAIGWGKADDVTSHEAVHAALDAGINFFDTADFYGLGHSEILLGQALKQHPEAIIATKVGHRAINNEIQLDYSKAYILNACEESLKRLERDVIDYYQLHSARLQHMEKGECIEAMQLLKQQGKIRYWGLSLNTFYPAAEAEFLMQNKLGDGFQLVFNIINQRAYNLIEKAGKKGYGIIARMPLQFGLLTGKFTTDTVFNENDHRHFRLTPEILNTTLHFLEGKVWPVARTLGLSQTELALRFILSCSQISTTIPGIRTPQHVIQNTVGTERLPVDIMNDLLLLSKTDLIPIMDLMESKG